MKSIAFVLLSILAVSLMSGCGDTPNQADDVVKKVESMKPEDRFTMIKNNTGMSIQMKEKAIDNLPVSDDQKAQWKADLQSQPAPGSEGQPRTN